MKNRGFTIIELLVAVAIVGILSGLAWPSYLDYSKRATRTKAASLLTHIAQSQQNHLMIRKEYSEDISALAIADESIVRLVSEYYEYPPVLAVTNGWNDVDQSWSHPPAFQATLVPIAGKLLDGDGTMCVNSTGTIMRRCQGEGEKVVWYED